ncbi:MULTISPECIES: DUF1643 domain-containing protein [unclassified Variovorax]|uniref:DUF1643 domain-containing protein n=1 Tax=unclassified Variovorax TaxID=663243 RepID=UPI00076C28BB|nr:MULTISPECIES: DUF1643 domain-containing protein [unclassified Variovorax]KWT89299.1 hypothetical protein APY03_3378 [Variovorax sp. WDL1]PNG56476.1 hypothetical protein CHC07_02893 [Variovorax sp. B4]PNG57899.1 hypothetical protein CHC06_02895 [Variovorax sp. B2]VTV09639.1 hypothetical protein WDL1CHR_00731 [Variovorax sp. WDL1]
MKRSAQISPCGKFRYRLGRAWMHPDTRPLVFIMLNPSTADANEDDATIRRCVRFAQEHAFGGIEVVNLFAFRATKPEDLRRAGYPVGPDNDAHIVDAVRGAGAVCLAWGSNVAGLERPQLVLPLIRTQGVQPMCLRITRSGYPQHPLMLPSSCRLMPFTAGAIQEAMEGAAQ